MTLLKGSRLERAIASKQYRDGSFHNTAPVAPGISGNPLPVLGEMFFRRSRRIPAGPLPIEDPRAAWQTKPQRGLRVTWLGHSTLLLELDGHRVLTDPVFGERASPVNFAGPKRFHPPPAGIADLPPLDCILLSHDHFDHLCESSQRRLARLGVPIVTSLGVGARLEALGFESELIHELDWWESWLLPGGELSLTAAPAQHFSGRSLSDRNATLWSSWVLKSATQSVFFSGDTGLTEEFATIAARLGPFDLTLLEIGAWDAAWGQIHLGPINALRAFQLLGAGTLLPVHWGTFDLALHPWQEPAETLLQLAERDGVRLVTPRLGRVVEPLLIEAPDPWWREVSKVR